MKEKSFRVTFWSHHNNQLEQLRVFGTNISDALGKAIFLGDLQASQITAIEQEMVCRTLKEEAGA